jgi:hypothetical protein
VPSRNLTRREILKLAGSTAAAELGALLLHGCGDLNVGPTASMPTGSTTSINVWQKHGVVVAPASSDNPGQPNVIFEGGAKILSGNVFKMWFGVGGNAPGVAYAESADGINWTRYSGNPVVSLGGTGFPCVFKFNGVYYMYAGALANGAAMRAYTSTDGITWTLQNASAIGFTQAWESVFIGQLKVVDVVNGVWYGYYTSQIAGTGAWALGLATSTDGINWTKSLNNPAITQGNPSNFFTQKINGTYYGWTQITLPGLPGSSDIGRYTGTNAPTGPWSVLAVNGNIVPTLYRTRAEEGTNQPFGQVADPFIVSANGTLYCYYTDSTDGRTTATYQISCATAPSTSFAELVQGYEGVLDVPTPTTSGLLLRLQTLASDNFQRPNANPINGNWSQFHSGSGFNAAQLVSSAAEGTVISGNADSFYNRVVWPKDQWSQITVNNCANGSSVGLSLRADQGGAFTEWRVYWTGSAGTPGTWYKTQLINGVYNTAALTPVNSSVLNVGDVITASIIGNTLSVYQNGNLIASLDDGLGLISNAGPAGFMLAPATSLGDVIIGPWSGGTF